MAALDIGDSVRIAAPVWRDVLDFCARQDVPLTTVPPGAGQAGIEAAVRDLVGVDAIAVFACPDPNTRVAREVLRAVLGPQSVAGLDKLLDKSRTRELCRRVGVPVPEGLHGPGPRIAESAAGLLARTGRVVVKDPTGHSGSGVAVIAERAELLGVLAVDDELVVETFLAGEEFSVEVVCGPTGPQFVGWVAKGCSDGDGHPLDRVRYAPAEAVPEALRAPCERLLGAISYRGVVEIELVVVDGRAYVLECNPRTSGVTPMLHFTGRGSSSLRLLAGLCGVSLPEGPVTAAADYALADGEARPSDPRAHCARPPAAPETRAYLWGEPTDLHERLSRLSPARATDLCARVGAAEALLVPEQVPWAVGR